MCFIDYEPRLHAYGSTLLRTAPIEGRRYTLKLSRDPWFPKVPTAPGFPLRPSYIAVRSSAYVCGTGYALAAHPPNRPFTDFHQITGHQAIACLEPFPCRPTSPWQYAGGLGRRRELHPSAPIAAAPALLEACGYSVCLASGWRPDACRGGAPACPFGQYVCLQLAVCPKAPGSYHREPWDRPPCMRAPQLSLRFRTCTK